jgi:hypothetical protein
MPGAKGGEFLENEDIKEALRHAVKSVREKPAVKRHKNISFSLAVKTGYDEIRALRDEGYSFEIICEEFVLNGVLPEGANPKALCSAFLRERKRKDRNSRVPAQAVQKPPGREKSGVADITPPANVKNAGPDKKTAPPKNESDDEARAKERIKDLTSILVDTGTGVIRKFTDGSFEF